MKRVAIFLAEGFEEVEAVTPADFLRRAGIEVLLTGLSGRTVTGAHGIVLQADCGIGDLPEGLDGVVLPGGMPGASNLAASEGVISCIRRVNAAGGLIAAICAAPAVVLAPMGMVKGKKATCYPGFEDRLSGAKFSEDRVVVDGNLITGRAPGTAAEFSVEVIRYLVGKKKASEIFCQTLQK